MLTWTLPTNLNGQNLNIERSIGTLGYISHPVGCKNHTVRPQATLSLGILKHSVAQNSVTGGLYVFSEG